MCHVEKRSGGVPLDPHISRLGKSRQGSQSTGSGDLGLIVLVRCEVGDAAHGIALNLYVGRHHLPDEGSQAAEGDDEYFVLS